MTKNICDIIRMFLSFNFIVLVMCICLCDGVYTDEYRCPQSLEKNIRSLGGGIGSGCGLPDVGSENLIQVLIRTMCALNY